MCRSNIFDEESSICFRCLASACIIRCTYSYGLYAYINYDTQIDLNNFAMKFKLYAFNHKSKYYSTSGAILIVYIVYIYRCVFLLVLLFK